MLPIHIDHAPKLIKWKNKTVILEFEKRFYSPLLFIVAFLSAFKWLTMPTVLAICAISAAVISYLSWQRWKRDFVYLAEREKIVPYTTCVFIVFAEYLLQFIVSVLSVWWTSNVPGKVYALTGLQRNIQGYLWCSMVMIAWVLHLTLWKLSSKEMERCLRTTYEHVEST